MAAAGERLEWGDILRDLEAMVQMKLCVGGKAYLLRTGSKGGAGKVFTACRVAVPPMLEEVAR